MNSLFFQKIFYIFALQEKKLLKNLNFSKLQDIYIKTLQHARTGKRKIQMGI